MNTLLKFALVLSFFHLKGQNYLTYGQVYDYDVGDVLQTQDLISCETPVNTGPPTVRTMSVTGKTLTSTKVTYTFFESTLTYTCFNCPPSYSTAFTNTVSYNILDTIPRLYGFYGNGICGSGPYRSVVFYQTAGRQTEKLHFDDLPDNSFEPASETDVYIAGLGGPFFVQECRKDISCHYKKTEKQLLYCYKIKGGSVLLGLENNNKLLSGQEIVVYPVPAKELIYVKTELKLTYYSLIDVSGNVVLQGKMSDDSINIESLKRGEYICAFQTNTHRTITTRFIKE